MSQTALKTHTQPDLFGGESTVAIKGDRQALARTEEEKKALSEARFVKEFSTTCLFAELAMPDLPEEDDDYEGRVDPELDAQLRISNADITSCDELKLEKFVMELHRACLEVNLAFLESEDEKPYVLKEKGFILQWVFCVDVVHGRHQSQIPLSFANCCMASGVRPDEFRGLLLQKESIRALLVRLRLVEAKRLPPLRKQVMYTDIVGIDHPSLPWHPVYMYGA